MKSVTLDPGKGGFNNGFIYENLIEKEINLSIALKCREELMRNGVSVEMTRENDSYVGYSQRIVKSNKNHSNAFVSIQCNLGGGSLCELIYSIEAERGLDLATSISCEIKKIGQSAIKIYNRVGHGNKDYNATIREGAMDSIIIKCGFLDNEFDRNLIDNLDKQNKFGIAIAKGILKYFNMKYIEE